MGVLFFADDISPPSVLWMRRMLQDLGDQVSIFATEAHPGPEYSQAYDVVVVRDSSWRWWWRLLCRFGFVQTIPKTAKAIRELTSAVRSNRVSVVLMHYLTSAVMYDRVWRRVHKPVFVHCHGYDVTWDFRLAHEPGKPAHGADYVNRVRALPGHVQFIANSLKTQRRLREIGIAEKRIHLKYLGVPVPSDPPLQRPLRELSNILYLGRLIDFKGPDLVIRAFDLACERGLRGRLVIAGDGPERKACDEARERAVHRDAIDLLGAVDAETGDRLRNDADIFTAHNRLGPTSRQEEAFGVSVIEAMAAGLPIVSGASGSLPEIVENEVQGILVEPGDIEGHAEAFLRLAGRPELRARMGRSGWQRVLENFSIERESAELRRILGVDAVEDAQP